MKKVRLIAYQPIHKATIDDLFSLNAIFVSPVEFFNNNESESYMAYLLEKKYAFNVNRLFNAQTILCFV